MADNPFKILGLAGSFRAGSLNQSLLGAAADEAPANVIIERFDLRPVPFYDGDLEQAGDPPEVVSLKRATRLADALLIVTPEYNGSLPAVLKNALDWTSRGYPDSALRGKITAIMGATPGRGGTRGAQAHLREILTRVGAVVLDGPLVEISSAASHIRDGRVESEDVRNMVRETVTALTECVALARRCGSESPARG